MTIVSRFHAMSTGQLQLPHPWLQPTHESINTRACKVPETSRQPIDSDIRSISLLIDSHCCPYEPCLIAAKSLIDVTVNTYLLVAKEAITSPSNKYLT